MGTRHLTVINDIDGTEICTLYGQWDGYLTGHGQDLKNFLEGFEIVNGYSFDDETKPKIANGMGCLAAQLIGHFKCQRTTSDGELIKPLKSSYHLCKAGKRGIGEEFIYTIYLPVVDKEKWYLMSNYENQSLHIKVQSGRVCFFGMPGTKPEKMAVLYDGPLTEFIPEELTK